MSPTPKSSLKFIMLNGPARCGKDTAAKVITDRCTRKTLLTKLAVDLKVRCHAAYGLWAQGRVFPPDAFEDLKDKPSDLFEGLSPRQAYIKFFENWLVPTHGPNMLATWLLRRVDRVREFERSMLKGGKALDTTEFVVVSDCRRREDVMPIAEQHGVKSVTLVHLRRDGYDWSGDIGGYVDIPGIRTVKVKNPESIINGLFSNLREAIPEVFAPRLLGPIGEEL